MHSYQLKIVVFVARSPKSNEKDQLVRKNFPKSISKFLFRNDCHSLSLHRYAYTKVPVIITDAQVNWTAQQIFNFDFFKNLYLNGDKNEKDGGSPLGGKNCQFFPYKTEFHSLKQAFRMDPHRANYSIETEPWYFGW